METQVVDLFRGDRWVRRVALHCLQGVVDFVVYAEFDRSRLESAVFVVALLILVITVPFLYFMVDEEQVGFVCGVGIL